jgi:hypothetical protein
MDFSQGKFTNFLFSILALMFISQVFPVSEDISVALPVIVYVTVQTSYAAFSVAVLLFVLLSTVDCYPNECKLMAVDH